MKPHVCSYAGARDEQIVAYLYEEAPLDERMTFERHLASCVLCRMEVDALRGIRAELGLWTAPEPSLGVSLPTAKVVPMAPAPIPRGQVPAWAQAAAAVLVVGVAMGAANLQVNYSAAQGLSVRTGWWHAPQTATVPVPTDAGATSSWRSELMALEQRLRSEMVSHPVPAVTPVADDASLRRIRVLVHESEQRQQRELALRFAEMAREVESQRQADLVKIDRSLGLIQSRTGMEVMRTQQQVNSLAQRVSQRQ